MDFRISEGLKCIHCNNTLFETVPQSINPDVIRCKYCGELLTLETMPSTLGYLNKLKWYSDETLKTYLNTVSKRSDHGGKG